MVPASLPFEYVQHLDTHRRTRGRPTGSRVRRELASITAMKAIAYETLS